MWNVKPDREKSSGGFQNADLGKTQFDKNYGPDFGIDYARFSDPPDLKKDFLLQKQVEAQLAQHDNAQEITVSARNGFIILKGRVPTVEVRNEITDFVRTIPEVVEVINQISVNETH